MNNNWPTSEAGRLKFVIDLYFDYSLRYIYEHNYLKKLYERFTFKDNDTMEKYTKVYETALKFVKEKLGE